MFEFQLIAIMETLLYTFYIIGGTFVLAGVVTMGYTIVKWFDDRAERKEQQHRELIDKLDEIGRNTKK